MERNERHVQLNSVSATPSVTPEVTPETQSSVTPEVILVPNEYTLSISVDGIAKHNAKYNTQPCEITLTQSLINHEGGRADTHVLLDCGSLLDSMSIVRVFYTRGESKGNISALYTEVDTPHFTIAEGGTRSDGMPIIAGDLRYEADSNPDKDGNYHHKKGDFIVSRADCDTMRFKLREVVPHLIDLCAADLVKTGAGSTADNIRVKINAERAKISTYRDNIIRIKRSKGSTEAYYKLLAKSTALVAELESKLAKLAEIIEVEPTEAELAELELELAKYTSPAG